MARPRSLPWRARRKVGYLVHRVLLRGVLSPDRFLTRLRGRWEVVERAPTVTALDAARANLDLVVDCLEQAGIDHFVTTFPPMGQSAVGVRASDRDRVRQALEHGLTGTAARVQWGGRRAAIYIAAGIPHDADESDRWRVFVTRGVEHTDHILGREHGCSVEFWAATGRGLSAEGATAVVEALEPERLGVEFEYEGRRYSSIDAYVGEPMFDTADFPVDVVYTWVDGSDPVWAAKRAAHGGQAPENPEAANAARYHSRDDLRFSLRSLWTYAPFVRHIYIVTDDQVPDWLEISHPRVTVVDHRDIFHDREWLPTFNSHAIESQLHHIPDLAEHYLYMNDDVYFGRFVRPELFFHGNGVAQHFLSKRRLDLGSPHPDEPPVMSAAKNVRDLLRSQFGKVVTRKVKHVPHPQLRSVHEEMESKFAEVFERTARSRFRSPADLSIASVLHHYYAYFTQRSVPGTIRYQYVDSSAPDLARRLGVIATRRNYDVFCINDTTATEDEIADIAPQLQRFFASYFPVPSPFERRT